jgi:hypothetical protein
MIEEATILQELLAIIKQKHRQGPPTQFHSWHLLSAFLSFSQSKTPLGRYQLAENLELGGGSIRSLIKYLKKHNLIQPVERRGHILSEKGFQASKKLAFILVDIKEVPATPFTVDEHNYGCHLRNMATAISDGLIQRDAAIQAGATGATTLIQTIDPNTIMMPINHNVTSSEAAPLLEPFDLEPKDVLIIGSASTLVAARLGTLAAALTVF